MQRTQTLGTHQCQQQEDSTLQAKCCQDQEEDPVQAHQGNRFLGDQDGQVSDQDGQVSDKDDANDDSEPQDNAGNANEQKKKGPCHAGHLWTLTNFKCLNMTLLIAQVDAQSVRSGRQCHSSQTRDEESLASMQEKGKHRTKAKEQLHEVNSKLTHMPTPLWLDLVAS
jgi:hypothetical protein